MKRWMVYGYLLLVHLALLASLWLAKPQILQWLKPPSAPAHYYSMRQYYKRQDVNQPAETIVFLGDSHTQSLAAGAVSSNAINYGIGSDTTVGLLRRLGDYQHSLSRAKAVVVTIGVNDMKRRTPEQTASHYQALLEQLSKLSSAQLYLQQVFPIDPVKRPQARYNNQQITELNSRIAKLAEQYQAELIAVPSGMLATDGSLKSTVHTGDGLHLNPLGYQLWISQLRSALQLAD